MKCYRCGAEMLLKTDGIKQLYKCSKVAICNYSQMVVNKAAYTEIPKELPISDEEKQRAYEEDILDSNPDYIFYDDEDDY